MPETENLHTNNSADLRNLLNSNQYDAVTYTDGPSVIVAGAGSGKTRVLTYKVAYLLQQGWHPGQILALTFTNKAAKEMKNRISKLVGEKSTKYLWVGTFHAIFSKILRYESKHIGFTSDFTIYDSSDSKSLIRSLVKELQLDDKIYKANNLQSRISFAKNQLVSPTDYANDSSAMRSDLNSRTPRFLEVYQLYCQRCRNSNAMDFDDLLIYTNTLFEKYPEILAKYQTRFGYILVDEYQDTNRAQHLIVSKLAAHHQRICVVGDDAQSIYSFRGANIDNMLLFQRQYDGCKLFKLEQNYRSTQTIVNAANSLISKNEHQIRKNVFSEGDVGKSIKVLTAYSDYDEAFTVANSMHESINETKDAYSDYAILYRTNAQSRTLEEALRKRAIPYKIYGGVSFYQRKEVKDILAYLRLIINPNDEESFKRIINYPIRGIGETTLQKILKAAHEQSISPLKLIQNSADFTLDINKGMTSKLQNFSSLMDQFIALNEDKDAYVVAEQVVLATGIMRDISIDSTPENLSRKENVQELLSAINQFCEEKANAGDIELKLVDFLSEVALLTDQDLTSEENQNHITMMTVHAAKGLEFKHVYIVGLEENLFPSNMCETEREVEEERRLLYVAITRAKNDCVISYAKSRFRHGQTQFSNPSRFLHDIDPKYLQTATGDFIKPEIVRSTPPIFSHFNPNNTPTTPTTQRLKRIIPTGHETGRTNCAYKVGMRVAHNVFGTGEIILIEGNGENTKAHIKFEMNGTKPLLLKYAKLTIID